MKKFSRAEWRKTPYAGTSAERTQESIQRLLDRYNVLESQFTRCRGPHSRPAIVLRFIDGVGEEARKYKIAVETLNAPEVDSMQLLHQAERAIFFTLKSALEMSCLFCPLEKALFAFLEIDGRSTMYDIAMPHLDKLAAGASFEQLALPPAPETKKR